MYGNNSMINIIYITGVWTTEHQIAGADPQDILETPTDGGYLCLDPFYTYDIWTTYAPAHGITLHYRQQCVLTLKHNELLSF